MQCVMCISTIYMHNTLHIMCYVYKYHLYAYVYTYILVYTCGCVCACVRAHARTNARARARAHTHTHTHTGCLRVGGRQRVCRRMAGGPQVPGSWGSLLLGCCVSFGRQLLGLFCFGTGSLLLWYWVSFASGACLGCRRRQMIISTSDAVLE